jgi:hypothetical protein
MLAQRKLECTLGCMDFVSRPVIAVGGFLLRFGKAPT